MRQLLLIGRKQRLGIVLRRRGAIKRLPQICLDVVAHFGFTPISFFPVSICRICENVHASSSTMCCTSVQSRCRVHPTRAGPCQNKSLRIQSKGLMCLSLVNFEQVVKTGVRGVRLHTEKGLQSNELSQNSWKSQHISYYDYEYCYS